MEHISRGDTASATAAAASAATHHAKNDSSTSPVNQRRQLLLANPSSSSSNLNQLVVRRSLENSRAANFSNLTKAERRKGFIKEVVNNAETIVDTIFILGPNKWEKLAQLAEDYKDNVNQLSEVINSRKQNLIDAEVISQYPDFNRNEIDTDESQKYFAKMSAFPDGYKCRVAVD